MLKYTKTNPLGSYNYFLGKHAAFEVMMTKGLFSGSYWVKKVLTTFEEIRIIIIIIKLLLTSIHIAFVFQVVQHSLDYINSIRNQEKIKLF